MTESKPILPITDIVAELQRQLPVRLEKPNLDLPEHRKQGHKLNVATAEDGQVGILSDAPEADPVDVEKAWLTGEYGYLRFIVKKGTIVGGVWSLKDSHVESANVALQASETQIHLSEDTTLHREASSFVFDHVKNAEQIDSDASLLQLAEEFGLSGSPSQLETMAVYMDDVEEEDRAMMRTLGFSVSADSVSYSGSDECTVFVATKTSVEEAIRTRAESMKIVISPQPPSALR